MAAKRCAQRVVHRPEVIPHVGHAGLVEDGCGDHQHGQVYKPRNGHGDDHIHHLEPEEFALRFGISHRDPTLSEGRVQIDDVRHDRGPDNSHRQQQAAGTVERRHEPGHHVCTRRRRENHLGAEGQHDDPHEPGDDRLEPAHTTRLQPKNDECRHGGEQRRWQQGQAEQEVQSERGADEFGHVGGHCHKLRLDPEKDHHGAAVAGPAGLRQIHP